MKYILIRHGETDWNKEGKIQGQKDIPLNEVGEQQAREVAQILKETFHITIIYTSPLQRARKTAEIIQDYLKAKLLTKSDLKEINLGIFLGKKMERN